MTNFVDSEKEAAEKLIKQLKLTDVDQKIIKHLAVYGGRNRDRWGTVRGLGKKINPENPAEGAKVVERRLKVLGPKLEMAGVTLETHRSEVYPDNTTVYALEPRAVQKSELKHLAVFNEPKKDTTLLCIADPGFGQIYHESLADVGAHYFLKKNGLLKKLDSAIVMGAVPFIPDREGKINEQYHAVLGKKIPEEQSPIDPAEYESLSEEEVEYRLKHYENKITKRSEAIARGRKSLENILGEDTDVPVHLSFGYQDHKNIDVIKRDIARDKKRNQEDLKRYLESQDQLKSKISDQKGKRDAAKNEVLFVKGVLAAVNRTKDPIEVRKRIKQYRSQNKQALQVIKKNSTDGHAALMKILDSADSRDKLTTYLKKVQKAESKYTLSVNGLESALAEEEENIGKKEDTIKNLKRFKEGAKAGDSKRRALDHFEANQQYKKSVSNIWPAWEGSTNNIYDEEVDLEVNGHRVRVEPKINRASDSVGIQTIKKQVERLIEDAALDKLLPDAYISGHDAGGYRAYPMPRYREKIVDGRFEDKNKSTLHVKLPTMQSADILKYCMMHNIDKLPDVKRKEKGNYATGIVLVELGEDGTQSTRFVSESVLTKLGGYAVEYEEIKGELKDRTIAKEKKERLEARLAILEEKFKIEPKVDGVKQETIGMLLMPEGHRGSPNYWGRTTNEQLDEAVIAYARDNLSTDLILYGGDNVHGDHDTKGLRTSAQDVGLLPQEIKKVSKLVRSDESLTADQKILVLEQLAYMNRMTQPIVSASKQLLDYADSGAIELGEEVIDKGGMVVIVAGNHYNQSNKYTHDEAIEHSRSFDRKYRNSGRIHVVDGSGERDGRGEVPLAQLRTKEAVANGFDYGMMYAGHSFKGGPDPVYGIMRNTQHMNLKEATVVVGFHLHTGGAGYAQSKHFFMGGGGQTTNKFVDAIGQTAGFRGVMHVGLSRNPEMIKGYQKATWVPLETLQQNYLKEETWSHKMLVEHFIPKARNRL